MKDRRHGQSSSFVSYVFAESEAVREEEVSRQDCEIVVRNCHAETLQTAIRGIQGILTSNHQEVLKSLSICLLAGRNNSVVSEEIPVLLPLLGQLFAVLYTHLEKVTICSYAPDQNSGGPQLLSCLVDCILQKCPPPRLNEIGFFDCTLDSWVGVQLAELFRGRRASHSWALRKLQIKECVTVASSPIFGQLRQAMEECPPDQRLLMELRVCSSEQTESDEDEEEEEEVMLELLSLSALCPHLQCLDLSSIAWSIKQHSMREFVSLLPGLALLKTLNLSVTLCFSGATRQVVEQFFFAVSTMQDLETLKLKYTQLPSLALQPLIKCLKLCKKIQRLDLSRNQNLLRKRDEISSTTLVEFIQTIASLPALQELSIPPLRDSKLLASLFDCLIQTHSPVQFLCISGYFHYQTISNCWVQYIPHLCPSLHTLDLEFNANDPGWPKLLGAMQKNAFLTGRIRRHSLQASFYSTISAIFQRNKLLSKIRSKGRLQVLLPSQWAPLLEAIATFQSFSDQTPLFLFLQYNIQEIIGSRRVQTYS